MFQNLFRNMPGVVKNLLILNVLMFIATLIFKGKGIYLVQELGMHYFDSPDFEPYQIATYFFMHSDSGIMHIFFNMFALVIFGSRLEQVWGAQRFLLFYFITALGAVALDIGIDAYRLNESFGSITPLSDGIIKISGDTMEYPNFITQSQAGEAFSIYKSPMVGASGAIFGILVAFAMLFPNTELMLLFPPIPIKAKYFVGVYVLIELYLGYSNSPTDNVAHFAHLGGALFGAILVLIWRRNRSNFY